MEMVSYQTIKEKLCKYVLMMFMGLVIIALAALVGYFVALFMVMGHSQKHVRIVNDLGQGNTLRVHCESKDDDLGEIQLSDQTQTEWSFYVNYWETTLFYCDLQWQEGYLRVDIFDISKDDCSQCWWAVTRDGIYYFNVFNSFKYELMFIWPSSSASASLGLIPFMLQPSANLTGEPEAFYWP